MSTKRCFSSVPFIAGMVVLAAACAPMSTPAPAQAGAPTAEKSAGTACQAPDGSRVSDMTIVYRCAVPGQGVTGCPRYVCQRCADGQWSGEYTCRLP